MTEFQTNLVPYPKFNFMISSYAPLISNEMSKYFGFRYTSVAEMTDSTF